MQKQSLISNLAWKQSCSLICNIGHDTNVTAKYLMVDKCMLSQSVYPDIDQRGERVFAKLAQILLTPEILRLNL